MAINVRQCPSCRAKKTINISYGEPTYETVLKADEGLIKLGGCVVLPDAPVYHCKKCGHEWTKEQAIEASYKRIKGLKASVGGFFDGFYEVEIDFDSYKVIWKHSGSGQEEVVEKSISKAELSDLIEKLKMTALLNWRANYAMPGVLDGTSWGVEVVREGRNIHKSGSNLFPDEWEAFCEVMRVISNRNFS
ncbi:hypothetical protein [Jeotgalibacillus salarius]|uniref:Uncharacterized protein n=1 Tax=Jeotgalibacillus salarius TaxID=546023 RepID=A0A4Y8LGI2_9BACL|nr:hypothetical protein [Jeotgalibacillus salarius]TFE01560.1 hypothetical protein E2626_08275 [Jeotgalibacillus salarius]